MSSDDPHNDKQQSRRKKTIEGLRAVSDLIDLPLKIWAMILAAIAAGGWIGIFVLHHEHQISLVVSWILALTGPVLGLIIIFQSERARHWAAELWHRIRDRAEPVVAGGLTLLLVVGAGQAVRAVAGQVFPGDCASPVDLRVLTAPENLTALRSAARAFSAAGDGHCGPVRVTVAPYGSLPSLRLGFQGGWYDAPGGGEASRGALQPDVIIPGSSAEVPYLADHAQAGVTLKKEGSIGTSPLAVGISNEVLADLPTTLSAQPSMRELLSAAGNSGVRTFLRASPDVSEIGALATADLYATKSLGDTPAHTEQALAGTTLPLGDSTSMLCGLQDQPDDARVAVIAPEQILADYANGYDLGDACPGQYHKGPLLTIYYPPDTHVLDYPFVHVTWPDQNSGRRASQVERFRHWLGGGRLRAKDFRDSSGHAAKNTYADTLPLPSLPRARDRAFPGTPTRRWLDRIALRWQARHVVLAVDRSGSMSGGRSKGGSRFTFAVDLASNAALSVIHDPDTGELDTFSKVDGKSQYIQLTTAARPPKRADMNAKLSGLSPEGSDMPLYSAIAKAAAQAEHFPTSAIIVFTDGGSQGGDLASAAKDLRDSLRGHRVPPVVVLTGTKGCDEVAPVKALGHTVSCVDTVGTDVNDTIAAILRVVRQ